MDACTQPARRCCGASLLRACALAVAFTATLSATAGSKTLASGAPPAAGETAGCSKVEGFVLGGAESLIVTTAVCGGMPRGWLSKPPAPGQNIAATDPSLVLDRLNADKLGSGQLFSSGPYCSVGGKELQWVAVYDWRHRKKIDFRNGGIRRAWVVDPAARRFVPAPGPLLESASCRASDSE